ncbi:MAG: glycosyltransferase family 4 protein [Acidobacteria bacterium]|nr:glycosyltransferase family 4 protein [Acidobacteriota bacterium]
MNPSGVTNSPQPTKPGRSARRQRIAFVSSGLGSAWGGIGVASEMMVEALQPDHDVRLWVNDARLPRSLRHALVVSKAWVTGPPEFVFYGHVFLTALHRVTPRLRNVPYGVFLHGIEVWEPLREGHRRALEGATVLVTNSQHTLDRARLANPWMPEAHVAWLGVPVGSARQEAGSQPPVAVIVGRIVSAERGKGHDEVLTAWPAVRAAVPAARLLVVGEGDDRRRLERRIEAEKIGGVEFRGYVSDRERDVIYQQSRALLFPSRQEGFGLVLAEAAAHGLPSLAVRGSVFEETFPEGHGVVFLQSTAPDELAPAIIRLLSDNAFASSAGNAAYDRTQAWFTKQRFMSRFREALRPLVP